MNSTRPTAPSSLYRSHAWRLALALARVLPEFALRQFTMLGAIAYRSLARHRVRIVKENLTPLCGDDAAATSAANRLFRQFALKLVDLWRYEAGLPFDQLFGRSTGWEHFVSVLEQKRGVLLLTPHLGNWEFGGPWLTQKGIALQVLTQAEPDERFTALRQRSRARWNIETLVVGADPFGFLEVIRRLENGATVALLMDRPPPGTEVSVELFGKPFKASIAAAELARASGCALLPVILPRNKKTYEAHVFPAVPYERSSLRERSARQALTQQIMRVFEPAIRQYPDQWYHFVPVWENAHSPSSDL